MTVKRLFTLTTATVGLLLVAVACGSLSQPSPPPPVIVNTTTGGDGGLMVLLTVVIGVAFITVIATVAFGLLWASERRRTNLEHALTVLAGRPVSELTVLAAHRPRAVVPVVAPRPGQEPAALHAQDR